MRGLVVGVVVRRGRANANRCSSHSRGDRRGGEEERMRRAAALLVGVAMAQAIAPAPSLGAGRRHPAQPALEVRGGAILRPRSGRKIDPRKRGLLFMFRAFFASLFDPDYGMNDGQIHSIAGTGRTAEDAAKAPTKLQSYHQASLDTMSAAMESAGCASGG